MEIKAATKHTFFIFSPGKIKEIQNGKSKYQSKEAVTSQMRPCRISTLIMQYYLQLCTKPKML